MTQAQVLTAEQYAELKARYDRHSAFVDTKRGKNGWAAYKPEEVPEDCRISNEEVSLIEVYQFINDPPEKYFAYVKGYRGYCSVGELVTWTGDKLGTVTFGVKYRDNFGGIRVPIRVQAINGRVYHGTYFESSGDYARIRVCKDTK